MRTRVLIHLLDASQIDEEEPLRDWKTINRELELFDPELAKSRRLSWPTRSICLRAERRRNC